MARSQETFNKKEIKNKKEKKRKEKEKKRIERRDQDKSASPDDMIAYVDEYGMITSTPPDTTKKNDIKLENIQISIARRETMEQPNPNRTGTVTFFNDSKGYGFIKDSETQESIFVHINNVEEEIVEGNIVLFEVEMGMKGPSAIHVKKAK